MGKRLRGRGTRERALWGRGLTGRADPEPVEGGVSFLGAGPTHPGGWM